MTLQTECDCLTWARDDRALVLYLEHHPGCPQYKPERQIRELLWSLIKGIEAWAADEDGVHPDCWDAYQAACAAVGAFDKIGITDGEETQTSDGRSSAD